MSLPTAEKPTTGKLENKNIRKYNRKQGDVRRRKIFRLKN
jgi:hypothetical protein